jgi:hypothetical protein
MCNYVILINTRSKKMDKEKLNWVKYAIKPVALVDSNTGEETPISSDNVVYINDEEFDEIINKLGVSNDKTSS